MIDAVNVAGNESATPTGNVTFTLYSGGTCNNGQVGSNGTQVGSASTGPIDANGDATSPTYSGLVAGNYYFVVSYAGDSVYPPTGNCEPFYVCPTPQSWTATVVNSGGAPIVGTPLGLGATVTDTANVTGNGNNNPTGSVTFTLYSGGTCNGQGSGGTVVGFRYRIARHLWCSDVDLLRSPGGRFLLLRWRLHGQWQRVVPRLNGRL